MAIKIRENREDLTHTLITDLNAATDAALTTQKHRDKTSVPTGDWFTASSTPLLIDAIVDTLDGYCTAVTQIKGVTYFHFNDDSAHLVVDDVNINFDGYVNAYDLATCYLLANAVKVDYNLHGTQSGVHLNNDAGNQISASDATDVASLRTLLADERAKINAHLAAAGLTQRYVIIPA